jgi:hypothetical protein
MTDLIYGNVAPPISLLAGSRVSISDVLLGLIKVAA